MYAPDLTQMLQRLDLVEARYYQPFKRIAEHQRVERFFVVVSRLGGLLALSGLALY